MSGNDLFCNEGCKGCETGNPEEQQCLSYFNGNLNAALILIDRALEEIENGFVRCERCGEQEGTKDLDFVDDIKAAKSELLLILSREM